MDGKAILDTNIVVRLLNGNPKAKARIDAIDETFLPCIVVGELIYGAVNSQHVQQNCSELMTSSQNPLCFRSNWKLRAFTED
jgi:predicted nucleic acid-binding protein